MTEPVVSTDSGWEQALDALEAQLLEAEAFLAAPHAEGPTPWAAPVTVGPLPTELAARATDLLEREKDVIGRIGPALRRLGQQQAVTRRISQTTGRRTTSIYIDASV